MKVSVIGATGYVGIELLRYIKLHPQMELAYITSESNEGAALSTVYPHVLGVSDGILASMKDLDTITAESDLLFIALPHGHSMAVGKEVVGKGCKIIDLGADYRFANMDTYEEWYKLKHVHRDAKRAYGLCEWNREAIKAADIVGNAGCYTSASILALAPLVKDGLIDVKSIVIDAKSGTTGAGRSPKQQTHFPDLYDNFTSYGACTHRHTPEIEENLSTLAGEALHVNFTPHLLPMGRGILATAYGQTKEGTSLSDISAAFENYYKEEFFIRLLGPGTYPQTKSVRGTNYCDLGWHLDSRTGRVIVYSCIDNLGKGAAGQAIQNANLLFGLDEKTGLDLVPMYP